MSVIDPQDLRDAVIDDRERGLFRVKRTTMTADAVWQAERKRIFDRCWLYLGHDSEIERPGDFVRRKVAGRPLVFVRGKDGRPRAFYNSCTHRGARVCRQDRGHAKSFQCFYHAWTFSTEGKLVGIPDKEGYAPAVDAEELGLRPVARLACYRDFWFVSFAPDVESLEDYLAGAKEYIDLVADQGADGMRVLPGTHQYACNANWKLMVENSVDGYHGAPLHHTYFAFLAGQGDDDGAKQLRSTEARAYDLGNGHAVVDYPAPFPRAVARWHPIYGEDAKDELRGIRDELAERCGEERAHRMAETCRNLLIYPNLLLLDVAGLTLRTVWPVRPDHMELTGYALAPRGESDAQTRRRLEGFNLFLGPGGLATPDDVEALEACQEGFAATAEDYSDISRGMHRDAATVDELQMRAFWREWQANMLGSGHGAHDEGPKPAPAGAAS
ncbi:aromatic ring-hydroxylating dioxygenase subunit alpha [Baekduia sp.]|uniref:aromatic ring-hydroxylating oxygenase subunit alpha n=1 Tax=Baekduia sp. TaxID=2600305 RepID=UPI0032C218AB